MKKQENEFIQNVKENYPKNKDKIMKAFEFASKAHAGVKRKSGEPYFVHPLSVAGILVDLNMDYVTIMAGLLHDVVEDTKFSLDDIKNEFGETVAKLVDGVTKIDSLTSSLPNVTEADSIKRLLIAMGRDVRVIFIKLADRLHNMRTIQFLSRERQIRMATETRDLFVPIAERIGIRSIRSELQNLVFKCLYPEEYQKIKAEFDDRFDKNKLKIKNVENNLNSILKTNGINGKIVGWPEHYYSIFKKKQTKGIGKIYGLMLFKVLVPTELDCYKTLGLFHKAYRHFPSQIKDFISAPKPNGYQSIHSVLMEEGNDVVFKVMIRTFDMDTVCEHGILSFLTNKDEDVERQEQYEKYNSLKQIILSEDPEIEDSMKFIDAIKTDLSQTMTWAFTPKLKPICLNAEKPTVLDFAYAVHSDIGNNAVGAYVNGKKVPLSTLILTGDVVQILLSNSPKAPDRTWLGFVATSNARRKIREYITKHTTNKNIELGKKLLTQELEKAGFSLGDLINVSAQILKDYNFVSVNDMLASVGYGSVSAYQISNYVFEDRDKKHTKLNAPVIIEGSGEFSSVSFPKCCSAIPGDEIVAVSSKNRIAIHAKNCHCISGIDSSRLLSCRWKVHITQNFYAKLKIVAVDRVGFASKILGIVANENFNVTKIEAKTLSSKDCEFNMQLNIKNTEELSDLIQKLKTIDGIKSVERV